MDDDCPHGIEESDWEPQGYLDGSVLLWTICRQQIPLDSLDAQIIIRVE